VPLSGEPADVHDRIAAYSAWLKTASLPKLFIDAEPGVFITGRIRRLESSFPNQQRVVARGLHFVQEDSPNEIGRAIASSLTVLKLAKAKYLRSPGSGMSGGVPRER
jgi:haloalkane dehalogenase